MFQLPHQYQDKTIENWGHPPNPPLRTIAQNITMALKEWTRTFPTGRGLLLMGGTGVGKTHLAVAAARKLVVERGFEVRYTNFMEMLERIHRGYSDDASPEDRDTSQQVMAAPVLLIDDLASQRRAHEWVEDTINSIISYRYDRGLPIIATTNAIDPAIHKEAYKYRERNLEHYIGPRARSRLFEMCDILDLYELDDWRITHRRDHR